MPSQITKKTIFKVCLQPLLGALTHKIDCDKYALPLMGATTYMVCFVWHCNVNKTKTWQDV